MNVLCHTCLSYCHGKTYLLDINKLDEASNILSKEFTTIHIETFENKLKINSSKDDIAKINKFLINKDFLVYEISLYSKSLEDEFIEQTESKQII